MTSHLKPVQLSLPSDNVGNARRFLVEIKKLRRENSDQFDTILRVEAQRDYLEKVNKNLRTKLAQATNLLNAQQGDQL